MGKKVKYPHKHIVSFRLSDPEWEVLEKWSDKSGMSISTIMRTVFYRIQHSFSDILQEELDHRNVVTVKEWEQRQCR